MAYSKSLAREELDLEALRLKKLAQKISYNNSPLTYDHKQLIYQSCIFLLSARVEDYTKNFIESILYNYRNKGAQLKQIPENSRVKAIIDNHKDHFKSYYNQEDEKKLITKLKLANTSYQLIFDDNVFTNQIKPHNIIATNKYPSLKNLNKVYNRLGIDNIVGKINEKSGKDLKTAFDSFLSQREAIAHQSSTSLTYDDIKRHFSNCLEFINWIDRIVYSHICKTSSSIFWK